MCVLKPAPGSAYPGWAGQEGGASLQALLQVPVVYRVPPNKTIAQEGGGPGAYTCIVCIL